jgi:glycosyltransferase involved in cell wall biosynthesis
MARIMSATSECRSGLVSVILPVRNGLPHLRQAIDSLRQQTYPQLEIIVIDDGSDDGTQEYLKTSAAPNLRVVRNDGSGIVSALNRGLAEAQGEYIARQDADDVSDCQRIERQVTFLQSNPQVDVVAACAEFIDAAGNPADNAWTKDVRRLHDPACSPDQIRALLPLTCCLIHGSILLRRNVAAQAGGYRAAFEWAEDYDLWLRLLSQHQFAKLPDRLYTYRIHGEQVSGQRRTEQIKRTIRAKLDYIRGRSPYWSSPARAWITGHNLGAAMYRGLLPEFGMVETCRGRGYNDNNGDWDLLIVTEFDSIDRYKSIIEAAEPHELIQEGNFFLRTKPDPTTSDRGASRPGFFNRQPL